MRLVLDASVALKWFWSGCSDEPDAVAAVDILQGYVDGVHQLLAPPHFQAEICAVLAREAPGAMTEILGDLLDLAIPTRGDPLVYVRAMQLSRDLEHHLFDTLYHAVALESEDAILVTADERYRVKAARSGRIIGLSQWSHSHR